MRASTCYMCDEPATSREHVPPKCIFPDDAHLRKSKDDELLRHVLACAPANNDLALRVIESGVMPSWDRRPHILETFLPNLTPLKYGDYETASLTIDVPRFDSSVRAIVRGLFFADTGKKLLHELTVAWGALLSKELKSGLCRLRFYEGHPIYVTWRMA